MVDAPESPIPQQQTPQKTFQNGVRTNGRAFNSPNWRVKGEESPSSSPAKSTIMSTPRSSFGRQNQVPQAISEGRRLYVGNMPYTAKMEDVQALFNAGGFEVSRIDISIDPFSGRNPSYCFVDLETRDLAERAMSELDGHDLLGRPVKIKPGIIKSASERQQQQQQRTATTGSPSATTETTGSPRPNRSSPFNADRWRRNDNEPTPSAPGTPSKSTITTTSSNGSNSTDSSRRLYVGGLPRLTDQEEIATNITAFFKGYNLTNISKLFTPHPAKRFEPGDHYYLFVDFNSVEDAQNAMAELNGTEGPWGASIRVQRARGETYSNNNPNRNSGLGSGEEKRARWGPSTRTAAPAEGVVEA
ncbi:hypothetical protein BJX61DRAFT_506472 [Aspergillus egyptiacus]|nr:hypothetical protein BJX61DRAFT_506472 [Aspergillus egyptiacus]